MHAVRRKITLPALLAAVVSLHAHPACREDSGARHLFNRLAGAWKGNAVTTPIGPRPYDIDFERRGEFWIYGNADPGAAIHHWGFYCESGELWLRFLSTFGGNRDPTLLKAVESSDAGILFRAGTPDFLAVEVRPGEASSRFEVLHHGERHVLIELERDTH